MVHFQGRQFLCVCFSMLRYGMRYMAKVMRDALKGKFPQAAEKDILKVGTLRLNSGFQAVGKKLGKMLY